ncbi:hypothetical protein [Streptomyces sp. NPDC046909]|uniref:hypothetical protein n=1 Tax=Streptomyces sp. NPDC046909 TaxID=3155617 RepID=UPI0033FAFF48
MDHFEQELARMMRESREDSPYEERHRSRLHAGVRARQRVRALWMATASVLTVTGLGVGLLVLASSVAQGGPGGPQPRPVTSAESFLTPSTAHPASTAGRMPVPPRTSTVRQVAPQPGASGAGE